MQLLNFSFVSSAFEVKRQLETENKYCGKSLTTPGSYGTIQNVIVEISELALIWAAGFFFVFLREINSLASLFRPFGQRQKAVHPT